MREGHSSTIKKESPPKAEKQGAEAGRMPPKTKKIQLEEIREESKAEDDVVTPNRSNLLNIESSPPPPQARKVSIKERPKQAPSTNLF